MSSNQIKYNGIFDGNKCKFIRAVSKNTDFPKTNLPEIAMIGRSNVGKSSLINVILNNQNIARTSKMPGCTKTINFFTLNERMIMADLPGYGYAKASKSSVFKWNKLINEYLLNRKQLKRIMLLIDSTTGLKDNDLEMIDFLPECGVLCQIILTKVDKNNIAHNKKVEEQLLEIIQKNAILSQSLILTSSRSKIGIFDIRRFIFECTKV